MPLQRGAAAAPATSGSWRSLRAAVAVVTLVASSFSPAAAVSVDARFSARVDLSRYRSYGWIAGNPAADEEIEASIRAAVERQLARKGWQMADSEPDVLVSTSVERFAAGLAAVEVVVVERTTELPAWRGVVGGLPETEREKLKKQLRKTIKSMFSNFPSAARAR